MDTRWLGSVQTTVCGTCLSPCFPKLETRQWPLAFLVLASNLQPECHKHTGDSEKRDIKVGGG